jgi:hypothetical protein
MAIKDREKLYKQGYFFLRKRNRVPTGKNAHMGGDFQLYISREFGSWRLQEKFDCEEDIDAAIEDFRANYNNVIVE